MIYTLMLQNFCNENGLDLEFGSKHLRVSHHKQELFVEHTTEQHSSVREVLAKKAIEQMMKRGCDCAITLKV